MIVPRLTQKIIQKIVEWGIIIHKDPFPFDSNLKGTDGKNDLKKGSSSKKTKKDY